MSKLLVRRRPGRPRAPRTKTEAALHALDSQISPRRRKISGKHRAFVQILADQDFRDPNRAATAAGFKEPYIGEKLAEQLRDLVDAERKRRAMVEQMEVEEALRIVAEIARTAEKVETRLSAAKVVLIVNGAMADKPLAAANRNELVREAATLIEGIKDAIRTRPGQRVKLEAMLDARVSAEAAGPGAAQTLTPAIARRIADTGDSTAPDPTIP